MAEYNAGFCSFPGPFPDGFLLLAGLLRNLTEADPAGRGRVPDGPGFALQSAHPQQPGRDTPGKRSGTFPPGKQVKWAAILQGPAVGECDPGL